MKVKFLPLQWTLLVFEVIIVILILQNTVPSILERHRDYRNKFIASNQISDIEIDLTIIQNKIEAFKKQLVKLEQSHPSEVDQAIFLIQLQSVAEKTGVGQIESIKPLEDEEATDFILKKYKISASGEYSAMMHFLDRLERYTPPFIIRQMNLKTISSQTPEIITVDMEIVRPLFRNR